MNPNAGSTEAEQAQRTLLAADIKRFLERPAEVQQVIPAADAPPGAPIGAMGMDFLAPVRCTYDPSRPDCWFDERPSW